MLDSNHVHCMVTRHSQKNTKSIHICLNCCLVLIEEVGCNIWTLLNKILLKATLINFDYILLS